MVCVWRPNNHGLYGKQPQGEQQDPDQRRKNKNLSNLSWPAVDSKGQPGSLPHLCCILAAQFVHKRLPGSLADANFRCCVVAFGSSVGWRTAPSTPQKLPQAKSTFNIVQQVEQRLVTFPLKHYAISGGALYLAMKPHLLSAPGLAVLTASPPGKLRNRATRPHGPLRLIGLDEGDVQGVDPAQQVSKEHCVAPGLKVGPQTLAEKTERTFLRIPNREAEACECRSGTLRALSRQAAFPPP